MSITKKQCEKLIDKLADKTLSFGCGILFSGKQWRILRRIKDNYQFYNSRGNKMYLVTKEMLEHDKTIKIAGHPVRIGDILERIRLNDKDYHKGFHCSELINNWSPCSFTKSL